jgi:predicted RNase H-like HicB family nuclease
MIWTADKPMAGYGYAVIYEELTEGGYHVLVPALPGIVTYGRNLPAAREMARDASVCHIKGLLKDSEEIPDDPFAAAPPVREELTVTI